MCLVRGKWNWLTEPSQQNHLDLRDTVSAEWLHYRKHAYAHICVCPPGPCGEVECISLLCPGRRGCWWGSGWGGGGREVAVVRKCAQYSTRNLSGAAAMMEATNVINPHSPYLSLSPSLSLALTHRQTTKLPESLSPTCSKHVSALKVSSLAHKRSLTKTNTARTQTDATTLMWVQSSLNSKPHSNMDQTYLSNLPCLPSLSEETCMSNIITAVFVCLCVLASLLAWYNSSAGKENGPFTRLVPSASNDEQVATVFFLLLFFFYVGQVKKKRSKKQKAQTIKIVF